MTDTVLIGSAEACQILGVDRSTLTRWVDKGRIHPVAKLPGQTGGYVFNRAGIDAEAARIKTARAEPAS